MRFLCATDLLPKSDAAIERAAFMAEQLGADLSLLHVVEPVPSERAFEQELSLAITQLKSRARAPQWRHDDAPNVIVKAGSPTQRVLETLEEIRAQLLVLGPHRERGLSDALGGNLTQKILRARKVPVLIARQQPRDSYQNILLAVDLSPMSAEVLNAAEKLVLHPRARATVVHASAPPYEGTVIAAGIGGENYGMRWMQAVDASVRDFLSRESNDAERYAVSVPSAAPAQAVLRAVEQLHPDLIVMGTHARGHVGRLLLGSVANEVLRNSAVDVLIVPNGSMRTSQRRSLPTHRDQSSERPRVL